MITSKDDPIGQKKRSHSADLALITFGENSENNVNV